MENLGDCVCSSSAQRSSFGFLDFITEKYSGRYGGGTGNLEIKDKLS